MVTCDVGVQLACSFFPVIVVLLDECSSMHSQSAWKETFSEVGWFTQMPVGLAWPMMLCVLCADDCSLCSAHQEALTIGNQGPDRLLSKSGEFGLNCVLSDGIGLGIARDDELAFDCSLD